MVELTERSDNAIEISGGQGENAGEFSLSNGKIDGMGKNDTSVYSIDDKAKGKLINVFSTNTGVDAVMLVSNQNVTVEENDNKMGGFAF